MAFPIKLRPETIARNAERQARERAERREDLRRHMAAKAAEHGPNSIYAEMLAELSAAGDKGSCDK